MLLGMLVGAVGAGAVQWCRLHPEVFGDFPLNPEWASSNFEGNGTPAAEATVAPPTGATNVPAAQPNLVLAAAPELVPATEKIPGLRQAPEAPMAPPEAVVLLLRHRGDSPMMRTWKLVGWPAILSYALSSPAPALATEGPPTTEQRLEAVEKALRELQKSLDALGLAELRKDVADMKKETAELKKEVADARNDSRTAKTIADQAAADILKLAESLTTVRSQLEGLSKLSSDITALRQQLGDVTRVQNDLAGLRQQVDALQRDVQALKAQPPTRESLYPSGSSTRESPRSGVLVLVNEYPEEIEVLVNQNVYRLRPNERREIVLAAGPFTYWVPRASNQANVQSRVLEPAGTFTVTVR
ncbi:MAG: hypothetical protein NZ700_17940 [Gemmataceae bacterium]|nr:hypothetical protein [Gemmataceae bacterium]